MGMCVLLLRECGNVFQNLLSDSGNGFARMVAKGLHDFAFVQTERERERVRERDRKEGARDSTWMYMCVCVHIYMERDTEREGK